MKLIRIFPRGVFAHTPMQAAALAYAEFSRPGMQDYFESLSEPYNTAMEMAGFVDRGPAFEAAIEVLEDLVTTRPI